MDKVDKIIKKIIDFRRARDWEQFHNPKDISLSLVLEAGEVMEHFQWKNKEEVEEYVKTNKEEIGDELADVLYWIILMGYDLDIDIFDALDKKIKKNEEKYPVEKAKGKHTKYNKL
ncbi:MAG: nucleotide pyrophosphohydrolase [Erysipelotrichia bacterium]|nr:MAG: MazG nucleotide pyrophosphohydrolase [Parcubacteria bacterium 33_209]KUK99097.1 MAG: MazG nucleotide pyrophosphohydrolase [Parcubacteria bacterium 32_520]NMA16308.1 nucleotide pyrophosphohydrolase [Erysipelotrichia bacterium]